MTDSVIAGTLDAHYECVTALQHDALPAPSAHPKVFLPRVCLASCQAISDNATKSTHWVEWGEPR